MAFFMNQKDPVQEHIDSVLSICDYGANKRAVGQQWKEFLKQYPQFEMTAEDFTYANMKSHSSVVFLRGIMILTIDNQQHEVPLYFVLINGFPSLAPKAFLAMDLDESLTRDNPFIHNKREILNQYMNNWKSNHASYNLNLAYYYIYQSLMICPPINQSELQNPNLPSEEEKNQTRFNQQNAQNANTGEDGDFK